MNRSNLSTRLGCLLIAALLPASALAIDPPARETSRFALKTNYLEQADEGIYELAFDNAHQYVFAAVTDRVNREANRGYLYAFNPTSLKIEHRYEMPYRAFSLAMNQPQHRLYIGHTQSASLRISLLDTATGKLTKTSDRLSFKTPNAADSRFEHLRHMVYSQDADTLFVSYSNMLKTAQGTQPLHRLLMLDGTTLALKGEVKEAYKGTGLWADAR
nr:putative receptor [Raoultella sp. NCTC 9187]